MTTSDDFRERVHRATVLVEDFPNSAIEFLASKFDKAQLEKEVEKCCVRHNQEFLPVLFRQRSSSNHSQSGQHVRPILHPQANYASHNGQYQSFQPLMPSPPTSAGSEANFSRGNSKEPILVFNGSGKLKPLLTTRANVRYNWISSEIATTRLALDVMPCDHISVPYAKQPSGSLNATHQVYLTWTKQDSETTSQDIFYLSTESMGADIVFGEQLIHRSQEVQQAAYMNNPSSPHEFTPGVHSNYMQSGTWSQPETQRSGASTITPFGQQHVPAGPTGHNPADPNSRIDSWRYQASTISQAHASQAGQAGSSAGTSSTPVPASSSAQQVRVRVKWDSASNGISLDLNASENVLLSQLQRAFPTRKLERSAFQLRLLTSKDLDAEEDDKFFVSFDESDLHVDWKDAVDWIKDQKPSARFYARIEPIDSPP